MKNTFAILIAALAMTFLPACGGKKTNLAEASQAKPVNRAEFKVPPKPLTESVLARFGRPDPAFQIADPDDSEQLAQLALALFEKGSYREAAAYFLKAQEGQPVEFTVVCLYSAALSHLLAGNQAAFVDTIDKLREGIGEYRLVNPSPELQALLALADRFSGKEVRTPAVLSRIIPKNGREDKR